jgi:hypothetical protein
LLGLLAERDRELEAPPQLEARLILAFRARKRRRRVAQVGVVCVVASFAIAILLTSKWMRPVVPQIAFAPPGLPAMEFTLSHPIKVQAESSTPPKQPLRIMAKTALPREVVTEFFPLVEVAPPFERGQIWRLEVPASTMRTVGLPVREEDLADRIQADVLVGEEGMLRAIRFVSFEVR